VTKEVISLQQPVSDDKYNEIKPIFQLFDEDENGTIDVAATYYCMRAIGLPMHRNEVEKLFKRLNKQEISFNDFVQVFHADS
jgi:Ca2+-binding EF-hand superfamily protein